MAGSSFFALLDDIASVLDDVAILTKVAAKKTAGVLGDDLALNAQQVTGVNADRELPVVWAVAKGSLKNKIILVPLALAISALIPWAILPLLMFGGAFLCFEGFEKLFHKFFHREEEKKHHEDLVKALQDPSVDILAFEKEKIAGAIRTDFVLSAEIVVITLGTVALKSLGMQVAVLSGIALLMTVGVYGLVALLVKLDDVGLHFQKKSASIFQKKLGSFLLIFSPLMMKFLSVAGTVAMFMVGGGIVTHGISFLSDGIHAIEHAVHTIPYVGGVLTILIPSLLNILVGVIVGAIALVIVTVLGKVWRGIKK